MMGRSVIVVLLGLNVLALLAGLALEYWRAQPRSLPAFNADKIRVLGTANQSLSLPVRQPDEADAPAPSETTP